MTSPEAGKHSLLHCCITLQGIVFRELLPGSTLTKSITLCSQFTVACKYWKTAVPCYTAALILSPNMITCLRNIWIMEQEYIATSLATVWRYRGSPCMNRLHVSGFCNLGIVLLKEHNLVNTLSPAQLQIAHNPAELLERVSQNILHCTKYCIHNSRDTYCSGNLFLSWQWGTSPAWWQDTGRWLQPVCLVACLAASGPTTSSHSHRPEHCCLVSCNHQTVAMWNTECPPLSSSSMQGDKPLLGPFWPHLSTCLFKGFPQFLGPYSG